jgi:hypothetical protein
MLFPSCGKSKVRGNSIFSCLLWPDWRGTSPSPLVLGLRDALFCAARGCVVSADKWRDFPHAVSESVGRWPLLSRFPPLRFPSLSREHVASTLCARAAAAASFLSSPGWKAHARTWATPNCNAHTSCAAAATHAQWWLPPSPRGSQDAKPHRLAFASDDLTSSFVTRSCIW